jgi:hypothetical protein
MSREWMALMRQLCTPNQQLVVSAIAAARAGGESMTETTTADAAELARRFGMASGEADAWARGSSAAMVLEWPGHVLDLVEPVGLFEDIGLDGTIGVLDRLARMVAEQRLQPEGGAADDRFEPALAG